jgi:RimJ/RimL family protein N-acetyltransferase
LLLRLGARVPPVSTWAPYYYFEHEATSTLLHHMAAVGEHAKAKLLLAHGAEIGLSAMPFPALLDTEHLVIRAPEPTQAPAVNAAIRESYDSLRTWMSWADHLPSEEETRAHLDKASRFFADGVDVGLYLWERDTGTFVGGAGLHARLADPTRRELGYWVRTSARGRGLATEAVRALAEAAFRSLALTAVEIHTSARNLASQRVASRAGFVLVEVRNDGRIDPDGVPSVTHIYERRVDRAPGVVGNTS